MRKFIVWNDPGYPEHRMELSPITADEFDKIGKWDGTNDISFNAFLRHNGFTEMDRLNEDARRTGVIVFELGEPRIDWDYNEHVEKGAFGDLWPPAAVSAPKPEDGR